MGGRDPPRVDPSRLNDGDGDDVTVGLTGGDLRIEWAGVEPDLAFMIHPAEYLFDGRLADARNPGCGAPGLGSDSEARRSTIARLPQQPRGTAMSETRKILVAIDDSDATRDALTQVAALHSDDEVAIYLFHLVGPIPPGLLEHGGGDTAEDEERLERELTEAEAKWFAGKREDALPMMMAARDRLVAGGVAEGRISGRVGDGLPEDRLARLLAQEAREQGCDTIVVGHNAYGWLAKHFHRDVAEDLRKHASDIRVKFIQ